MDNCISKKDEKCEEEDRYKKKTVKRGKLQKAYLRTVHCAKC